MLYSAAQRSSVALQAHAETAPAADAPAPISEVVVTAMKHSSTVQTTPASIEAVSGASLQARGVTSFATLAQGTPGVSLKSEGPSQTEVEMRGMTSSGGNSATVGFYLDDVPLAGPANAQNGHSVIGPRPLRPEPHRSPARASRHAVRIGFHGRDGSADHQSA